MLKEFFFWTGVVSWIGVFLAFLVGLISYCVRKIKKWNKKRKDRPVYYLVISNTGEIDDLSKIGHLNDLAKLRHIAWLNLFLWERYKKAVIYSVVNGKQRVIERYGYDEAKEMDIEEERIGKDGFDL